MIFSFLSVLIALGLLVGMLVMLELGRRIGIRDLARDTARVGLGPIEGAIFALMGLLVAFTFSGAASRFDLRRMQIVEEANAIHVAWLRLEMLPTEPQTTLRELFRQYLDARIGVFQKLPDFQASRAELARAEGLQERIWTEAETACHGRLAEALLVLPALNEMFDIARKRVAMPKYHPPVIVYIMLGLLALMGSLLAGHGMAGSKNRNWLHRVAFVCIFASTIAIILDLEVPRMGLIRIGDFDQILVELRQHMK